MRTIEDILADQQAIVDAADGRALTAEEADRYEALEGELSALRRSDGIRARQNAYLTPVNSGAGPAFIAGGRKPDTYETAFNAYMRTGKVNDDLTPGPGRLASNAGQSEGVPSEGGYLVPDSFRTKLVEKLKAFGGIGNEAERYNTGDGRPVEWPTVDDTGNQGEIVEENGTFSAGADVVVGSNGLTAYEYMAGGSGSTPLRLSRTLVQDAAFDVEGMLARFLGTRIARIQAVHWATGTGVKQPLGLTTGRTPVQAAANTGFTFADFVTWKHSIDPAYRDDNCVWVMNDTTVGLAEKLTDSHGDPLVLVNRDLGGSTDITRILGYRVRIDQAMPDYDADDSTDLAIAFGNIRAGYVIRDILGVELLVNPYSRMNNRQIEYTAWARADGTQQDTNAYIIASGKS